MSKITKLFDDDYEVIDENEEIPTDFFDVSVEHCIFIMVDIQEKFKDVIKDIDIVVKNANILNKAAEILGIPLVITEQSPEKLGKTMDSVYIPKHAKFFSKTLFSAITDDVYDYIIDKNKYAIVIYGIEAHVCVLQTCLEINQLDRLPAVVLDAIASRTEYNKQVAIMKLAHEGIETVTTEMLLFSLLKDANHPKFKEISKLVK